MTYHRSLDEAWGGAMKSRRRTFASDAHATTVFLLIIGLPEAGRWWERPGSYARVPLGAAIACIRACQANERRKYRGFAPCGERQRSPATRYDFIAKCMLAKCMLGTLLHLAATLARGVAPSSNVRRRFLSNRLPSRVIR